MLYLQKQVWSMKLIERSDYTERIERAFGKGVIVALTGQRRVGKSCIMAQVMRHIGSLPQANVVYLNKEKNEFDDIRNYNDLLGFVNGRLSKDKDNYLFIDEIQDIDGFERALRSLQADDACQIMVTGSNAKMLSSELTTYLSGRHIDYHIHSLGYEEFLLFHKMPDGYEALTAYLQYGGLPQLGRIGLDDRELVDDYLESVYSTILLKDIVERGQIRNVSLLKTLVRFMADNIGKLFSATSIVNFLKGQRVDTSAKVILNYLDLLCDAYIINRVSRYDIHGKRIFELGDKYYFEDLGLRNHIVGGNRSADIEKVMENAVYLSRHVLVHVHPSWHEHQFRTQPFGLLRRHGRPHPVFARLVTGRSHHATCLTVAHGYGFAAQFGMVALLYRCVEGVHVHVYDFPFGHIIKDLFPSAKIASFGVKRAMFRGRLGCNSLSIVWCG